MWRGRTGEDPAAADGTSAVRRKPLWTVDFLIVLTCTHLVFASFFSTFTTVPLYLEDAAKWQIGLVVGSMGLAGMLIRPLSGLWADRYGRRLFMVMGAGTTSLSLAAQALSDDPYLLLPLRMVNGMGMVLFVTAAFATVADIVPADRRGIAFGYLAMVNGLSQIYAPWLALTIARTWGFTPYFLTAAVVAGLASFLSVRVGGGRSGARATEGFTAAALVSRSTLLPASLFLTLALAFGAVQAFLPLMAEDRGLGNPGLFFVLYGLVAVPLRPMAGAIADRRGRAAVFVPGLVVGGLAMLLLAGASMQGMMLGAAVLFALGLGGAHTALLTWTVDRAGSERRGVAMSTFGLAWDTGSGVGALTFGLMAGLASYGVVFAMAGAFPLAASMLFLAGSRVPRPRVPDTGG
ncbi:MAG: MFS transporter [Dehalococcoidia bacterium]|nr:MAG: MFS transporter [Dehalococcoidia bacterium]